MNETIRRSSRRFRKGHAVIKGYAPDGAELYITRGDDFELRGGTPESHAQMVIVAKEIMQVLRERGYNLARLNKQEFNEVAALVKDIQDGKITIEGIPPLE